MKLFDAHNHLHDAKLAPHREEILRVLGQLGVERFVVNGTREDDWPEVAALQKAQPGAIAAYGLHPWYVTGRSPGWLDALQAKLAADPQAGLGEIGLDRWVKDHDLPLQTEIFLAQLQIAAEENRHATIHCLKAWGALWEAIEHHPVPKRGFLIHAYGGPLEMVKSFARRGARFSFNAYYLHERKHAQREVFLQIPLERLLVETDAPDMLPPEERNRFPLEDAEGAVINHPGNLTLAYEALAEIRGMPGDELAGQVERNFAELFGAG